jgi:serine/threonine protein kinase
VAEPYRLSPGMCVAMRRAGGDESLELHLIQLLGQGANSQTWLAASRGETFAVKAPLEDLNDNELTIEERIVQQFHHPAVVSLGGVGVGPGGRLILAYERLFANPLSIVNRPSVRPLFPDDPGTRFYPLPPPVAINLCVDLLSGIDHMHKKGFVHHDIKPDNLMVRVPLPKDEVAPKEHEVLEHVLEGRSQGVLVDLGSSRSKAYLAELNTGANDSDLLVVPPQLTPINAPPESLLPNEVPGLEPRPLLFPSLDLYAAAITVYAMVTGRSPYDHLGLDTSSLETLRDVKAGERDGKLLAISSEALHGAPGYRRVADDLYALLSACTHRDPRKRPTPAGALQYAEELQRAFAPSAAQREDAAKRLEALEREEEDAGGETFFGLSTRAKSTIRARAWELRTYRSPG